MAGDSAAEHQRQLFTRNMLLIAILFAVGILLGFVAGREFPRETLLEKECREWAEKTMLEWGDRDLSRFPMLLGACMKGGR